MNYTKSLLEIVDGLRKHFTTNKFFTALKAGELDGMDWVWQLWYQSDGFTRALSLRSALCEDMRFKEVFAQHACEEIRHPFQLLEWMRKEKFDISRLADIPATPATKACVEVCTDVAKNSHPIHQVFILNVLSEGLGLTFYTEVIDRLKHRLYGPYWHIHKEVDDIHMGLGLDAVGEINKEMYDGLRLTIDYVYNKYYKMVESFDPRLRK